MTSMSNSTLSAGILLFPGERVQAYVGGVLCVESHLYYQAADYDKEVSTTDAISMIENIDCGMVVTFGADCAGEIQLDSLVE